jgi:hypothetical protein
LWSFRPLSSAVELQSQLQFRIDLLPMSNRSSLASVTPNFAKFPFDKPWYLCSQGLIVSPVGQADSVSPSTPNSPSDLLNYRQGTPHSSMAVLAQKSTSSSFAIFSLSGFIVCRCCGLLKFDAAFRPPLYFNN